MISHYLVTDTGRATRFTDPRRARRAAIGCKRAGITPTIVRAGSPAEAREAVTS